MAICVNSEIGRLKKVLLHRPGKELEHLVPGELERLLFDDIPYLRLAQQEHDTFAAILREQGAEVVYLEDLMAETLRANPGLRVTFVRQFLREGGPFAQNHAEELFHMLSNIEDERELVLKTMSGVTGAEMRGGLNEGPLTSLTRERRPFVLDPIPNLYFTRDPFASIGCGVSVHRMYSVTRCRETIYGDYIMRHHPDFAGKVPLYYDRNAPFNIEGGDIHAIGRNNACGIGNGANATCGNVFLGWTRETDRIYSSSYPAGKVGFVNGKNFLIEGTDMEASISNINGQSIVPLVESHFCRPWGTREGNYCGKENINGGRNLYYIDPGECVDNADLMLETISLLRVGV